MTEWIDELITMIDFIILYLENVTWCAKNETQTKKSTRPRWPFSNRPRWRLKPMSLKRNPQVNKLEKQKICNGKWQPKPFGTRQDNLKNCKSITSNQEHE